MKIEWTEGTRTVLEQLSKDFVFPCQASPMTFIGSTFSFLSVEIIVLLTEWLVCLPVNPAASFMDFTKEPSEFFSHLLFLVPNLG